jgi:hypothetical protein
MASVDRKLEFLLLPLLSCPLFPLLSSEILPVLCFLKSLYSLSVCFNVRSFKAGTGEGKFASGMGF